MKYVATLLMLLICSVLIAQSVPFSINYQAIARDANGKPILNASIDIEISILQGSTNGNVIFSETHSTQTNQFGLYMVLIGDGNSSDDLSTIDWATDEYFIETRVSINNSPTLSSTARLSSVPYAFLSQRAVIDQVDDNDNNPENEIQELSLNGNILSLSSANSIDLSDLVGATGADNQQITDFSLNGNMLTVTIEDGNTQSVNLEPILSDNQQLSLVGTILFLEGGGQVDLTTLQDGIGTDDQTLSLNGTEITIENGNSIDLSGVIPTGGTDDQTLILTGTDLMIEDGNSVDLITLQDGIGTDDQMLSLNGTEITIENGNSIDLSGVIPIGGTDDQTLTLTGTDLMIENGNSVDLSDLQIWKYENNNQGIYSDDGLVNVKNASGETLVTFGADFNNSFLEINNSSGEARIQAGVGNLSEVGTFLISGTNGNVNTYVGQSASSTNHGGVGVYNSMAQGSTPQGSFVIDENGRGELILRDEFGTNNTNFASIYYDAFFGWTATFSIKNFVMPHPKDKNKEIVYACIEGPEAAAYVRGTAQLVNGEIFVPFSEDFKLVINHETMTVNLTPNSINTYGLAVVEKTENGILVKELMNGESNFTFDWEVKAVRKGYESYQPVRPRREATRLGGKSKD